jgi:hypothetical protein
VVEVVGRVVDVEVEVDVVVAREVDVLDVVGAVAVVLVVDGRDVDVLVLVEDDVELLVVVVVGSVVGTVLAKPAICRIWLFAFTLGSHVRRNFVRTQGMN